MKVTRLRYIKLKRPFIKYNKVLSMTTKIMSKCACVCV